MTTKPKRPQRRSLRNIQSWRDVYQIHPAALLLPRMARDELRTLGEDIKTNGLHMPIVMAMYYPKLANGKIDQHKRFLGVIDGISRLDAMELVSLEVIRNGEFNRHLISVDELPDLPDPFEYVLSINLHRRHLTSEQKRQTIEKAIMAKPELSNSGLAKMLHGLATDKTIATVRRKMEGNSEIPNKTERKEASGRKARGRKPGSATKRRKPVTFSGREPEPDDNDNGKAVPLVNPKVDRIMQLLFDIEAEAADQEILEELHQTITELEVPEFWRIRRAVDLIAALKDRLMSHETVTVP